MRVIAGYLGGRQFDSPKSNKTHPMSDKMRGALFNTLGDIEGLSILDAFAGTGALGFEAISRGAQSVVAIENDSAAQQTIQANIQQLQLEKQVKLIKASVNSWLTTADLCFDIVLCDPPYDHVQLSLLVKIADRLKAKGVIALSLPANADVLLNPSNYELLISKIYGDGQLIFYRRIS